MKTTMQELIEWCNSCLTDLTLSDGAKTALEVTIVRATDLLEKEKEQIIEARLDGFKISGEGWNGEYPFEGKSDKEINTRIDNEGYYNQTYKQ